jgi:hypothetical protein
MSSEKVDLGTQDVTVRSLKVLQGIESQSISRIETKTIQNESDSVMIQAELSRKSETFFGTLNPPTSATGRDGDYYVNTTTKGAWYKTANAWVSELATYKTGTFIADPTTPYWVGDTWAAGPTGDFKRCTVTRLTGNYNSNDWSLASKYTDDTVAGLAQAAADAAQTLAESKAQVFYVEPVGPYAVGDLWVSDSVLYQAVADRATGFLDSEWVWCIRSNLTVTIESTNGDHFRPGTYSTTLKARVFRNAIEITADIPLANFCWTRLSADTLGDAVWNGNHFVGYNQVFIGPSDVSIRATFSCVVEGI